MVPHEPKGRFRGVLTMVWTMLRGVYHPVVRGTVSTVATARVWNQYAVLTAVLSCTTGDRLCSTCIRCPLVYYYRYAVYYRAVCVCAVYPLWRYRRTLTHTIVVGYYHSRRRGVVLYPVVE